MFHCRWLAILRRIAYDKIDQLIWSTTLKKALLNGPAAKHSTRESFAKWKFFYFYFACTDRMFINQHTYKLCLFVFRNCVFVHTTTTSTNYGQNLTNSGNTVQLRRGTATTMQTGVNSLKVINGLGWVANEKFMIWPIFMLRYMTLSEYLEQST